MSTIKVVDPSHITLPAEVGALLNLKGGDTMLIRVEGQRIVLEKSAGSPVDEAFGIWPEIEDSVAYVNQLRDEQPTNTAPSPAAKPMDSASDIRRQQQMDWLKANAEKQGGQYVALVGEHLISTGKTFQAAQAAAIAAGQEEAFITYLPKPDEALEMGGWA